MTNISNTDDTIDVRDIIARVEELEKELLERFNEQQEDEGTGADTEDDTTAADADSSAFQEWLAQARADDDEAIEYNELMSLLSELKGNGGHEQWRGYWYPATLIRADYFEEYAEQLADDIGAINNSAVWPNNCIDWKQAARELQYDYTSVEFDGVTYWYR